MNRNSQALANDAAANLAVAFGLYEGGVEVMRQNLRRRDPDADEATLARRLSRWLGNRVAILSEDDLKKMGPVTLP